MNTTFCMVCRCTWPKAGQKEECVRCLTTEVHQEVSRQRGTCPEMLKGVTWSPATAARRLKQMSLNALRFAKEMIYP
jgi:hypothetical protein